MDIRSPKEPPLTCRCRGETTVGCSHQESRNPHAQLLARPRRLPRLCDFRFRLVERHESPHQREGKLAGFSMRGSLDSHYVTPQYLFATRTHLQTSNARVAGVFNSTQSIDIFTSNAIIDGEFNLSNDERPGFSRPSTINLATSNACVYSHMPPFS